VGDFPLAERSPLAHASVGLRTPVCSETTGHLLAVARAGVKRVTKNSIEISVKGKWTIVPALFVEKNAIIVRGKWLKIGVIEAEDWLESEIADPEACIRKLKESGGLKADIFAFSQKVPNSVPRYPYNVNWDSCAVIRMTGFNEWWTKLPQETRKNVRRSQKRGVTISVREVDDTLVRDLVSLNNDSPLRQGKRFTHYGKTFEQVKKDQMAFLDRSDYICAYVETELVGILKLVYRGDSASILTFYSKPSHADKRPANALLAKAVELCDAKRISHLVYGKYNYGNKRDSTLRDFKIRHGFEEMLLPRYYVPITRWGSLCLSLGLHRGLMGVLPPRVIAAGGFARAGYYRVLQLTSRCSSMIKRSNRTRQMERSIPPAGSNS
jgi:hypothetical protein